MSLDKHVPEGFIIPDCASDRVEFWRPFWAARVSPWDLGRAHPEIAARRARLGSGGRAYVPGCGLGHDALGLAEAGYAVTAVDFCPELEPLVRPRLEARAIRFELRDALALTEGEHYDLWWDHTFLCALPRELRPDWARALGRALARGGLLAALVFPSGKPVEAGGPPFGLETADLVALLGDRARLLVDEDCLEPARPAGERFALFEILPEA
ncbi:MAG: methyltransferase domain-containing protein [Planctomycetes bacterium]|nr:methyltransferase domain-containing protein [Planctomycetota bacterium]